VLGQLARPENGASVVHDPDRVAVIDGMESVVDGLGRLDGRHRVRRLKQSLVTDPLNPTIVSEPNGLVCVGVFLHGAFLVVA
jgi:hypothetical protein